MNIYLGKKLGINVYLRNKAQKCAFFYRSPYVLKITTKTKRLTTANAVDHKTNCDANSSSPFNPLVIATLATATGDAKIAIIGAQWLEKSIQLLIAKATEKTNMGTMTNRPKTPINIGKRNTLA